MKILIFSDLHIHNWQEFATTTQEGITNRAKHCLQALRDIANASSKHKPDIVVFCGDFFERAEKLDPNLIRLAVAELKKFVYKDGFYALVGNHDWTSNCHALSFFQGWEVITTPTKFIAGNISMLPYSNKEDIIITLKQHKSSVLFGHFGVREAKITDDGYTIEDAIPSYLMQDFDKVFLGHYHLPQQLGNIQIIGSPLAHRFKDSNAERGYYIYDGRDTTFYPLNYPEFYKLEADKYSLDTMPLQDIIKAKNYFWITYPEVLETHPAIVLAHKQPNIRLEPIKAPFSPQSTLHATDSPGDIVEQYIQHIGYDKDDKQDVVALGKQLLGKEWGVRSRHNNIVIRNIRIENFNSISNIFYTYPENGVVAVEGVIDNDDKQSNGAGKSSFLEALCWCIYGKTTYDHLILAQDIVNEYAVTCTVTVELLRNNILYSITRERSRDKGAARHGLTKITIYEDSKEVNCKTIDDYNKYIENDILGISYPIFKNTIFFGQKDRSRFEHLQDKEKKILLEELKGTEVIGEALDTAKDWKKKVEEQKAYTAGEIATLERERDSLLQQTEKQVDIVALGVTLQTKVSKYAVIEKQLKKVTAEKDILNNNINRLRQQITENKGAVLDNDRSILPVPTKYGTCPTCLQVVSKEQFSIIKKQVKEHNELYDDEVYRLELCNKNLEVQLMLAVTEEHNTRTLETEVNKELRELELDIATAKTELEIVRRGEKEQKLRLAGLQANIIQKHEEQVVMSNKLQQITFWIDGFGHKRGLRAYIIEGVLTELQEYFNEYFAEMLPGYYAYFHLDSTGSIQILFGNNQYQRSLGTHSGGETKRVSIALMLAFHRWMKKHINNINILVMDEILDELDEAGIDVVCHTIKKLGGNELILLTSHTYNLDDITTNTVKITKNNSKSALTLHK